MPDQHDQLGARYVTARHAAELTGRNERTIRRMIARGELPARKLASNRFAINVHDLPARRPTRQQDTQNELDALRRDLDALKRRVVALETAQIARSALRGDSDGLDTVGSQPYHYTPSRLPDTSVAATYEATLSHTEQTGALYRVSDASGFLARHGINYYTPKTWRWLRDALTIAPLTQDELLRRVIEHKRTAGYRAAALVLHRCTDVDCPCQVLL